MKASETREVIWPFDEEIKASGLLRVRDYGHSASIAYNSRMRPPFQIIANIGLSIVMAGGVIGLILEGVNWIALLATAIPLIVIYGAVIHPYVGSWLMLRKHKKAGFDPPAWTFGMDGIRVVYAETNSNIRWSLRQKAIVTRQYVLLFLNDQFHLFACPMFKNLAAWRNFRAAIIRNFVGCRGCKYDLHGTTSDTCPECGKPIDY